MVNSAIVYFGFILVAAGLILAVKPSRRLRISTRRHGLAVAGVGTLAAGIGLMLPAPESRSTKPATRLDEFTPVWQFQEFHQIAVAAPPARVFEAIERTRADEIAMFRTLIWIRRFGRPLPPSVQNPGTGGQSLVEVILQNGFVSLALERPRELVVGTVINAPAPWRGPPTPELFQAAQPPGFVLATMDFVVTADGAGGSVVTTTTRVFANSPSARRRFAAYWRIIYPGSALIRRMWLRAIRQRATLAGGAEGN